LTRPTDLVGFAGDAGRAARQLDWTASVRMPEVAARMVSNEQ
jgi:GDP-D-mannose dehydratase